MTFILLLVIIFVVIHYRNKRNKTEKRKKIDEMKKFVNDFFNETDVFINGIDEENKKKVEESRKKLIKHVDEMEHRKISNKEICRVISEWEAIRNNLRENLKIIDKISNNLDN